MGGLFGDVMGFIDAGRAANAIANANIAAEHGVLGATSGGQADIQNALTQGRTDLTGGLQGANTTLGGLLNSIQAGTSPFMQAGAQGLGSLMQYAQGGGPKFSFDNPQQWMNSPAYQFQLQQGFDATQNSAAARGLGDSGNTLKALTQYGQGLASTYYNDAFNRAAQTYGMNQQSTLQNLGALIGAGQFGLEQQNQALQNLGGQQAQNQMGTAQMLANMGLLGNEDIAKLGLQGATTAGNFGVGAGQATAAGILGQGNALSQGFSDLGSAVMAGMG